MFNRLALRVLICLSLATAPLSIAVPAIANGSENPWKSGKANKKAMIFITIKWEQKIGEDIEDKKKTSSGFMVKGKGNLRYILTSAHGLMPSKMLPDEYKSGCTKLKWEVKFKMGTRGGTELDPDCVLFLKHDLALVRILERDDSLPQLELTACDLRTGNRLFLAGFPFGRALDAERTGTVTSALGKGDTMVTSASTAAGMSGGPYALVDGSVAAFHIGGVEFTSGFAHMMPISRIVQSLHPYLPKINGADEKCPSPEPLASQLTKLKELIHGKKNPDSILATIENIQKSIARIRKDAEEFQAAKRKEHDLTPKLFYAGKDLILRLTFKRKHESVEFPEDFSVKATAFATTEDIPKNRGFALQGGSPITVKPGKGKIDKFATWYESKRIGRVLKRKPNHWKRLKRGGWLRIAVRGHSFVGKGDELKIENTFLLEIPAFR